MTKSQCLSALILLGILVGGNAYVYQRSNKIESHLAELHQENEVLKKNLQSLQEECGYLQEQKLDLSRQIGKLVSEKRVGVNKRQLRNLIRSVLSYLGEPNLAAWTQLIMITAATESDMGHYLHQVRGPAQGILQIEAPTERDVLDYLKMHRPKDYQKVKDLRCKAHLTANELTYNAAYCAAICYWIYRWRKVNPVNKTNDELIVEYKRFYNTTLGKATIKGTKDKLRAFNIN